MVNGCFHSDRADAMQIICIYKPGKHLRTHNMLNLEADNQGKIWVPTPVSQEREPESTLGTETSWLKIGKRAADVVPFLNLSGFSEAVLLLYCVKRRG